jgi:radical S-adenosyl methionine domain-containing protein 2|tara:strand:- start:1857 stop:2783 length:927 start_codon:yes stop_codon:yes gene_type:complete
MSNDTPPIAVNWHLEAYCNYGCSFCYAPLTEQRLMPRLSEEEGASMIEDLSSSGVEKINFVGGEPMLHPHLEAWIVAAKSCGLTTSIVSNGTKMTEEWLTKMRPYLDWLGLSIDASNDEMHFLMGRGLKGEIASGFSRHLERSKEVWQIAQRLGYGLKLNTVVTSVNADDDMSELVGFLKPHRWKIFRVLRIEGENDGRVEPLLICQNQFDEYMIRHRRSLRDLEGIQIVAEDNEDMLGTYAMIDPQGMVYTNLHGCYHYSKESVVDIGFIESWKQVMAGFSQSNFEKRGGLWKWENPPKTGYPLPQI